MSSISPPAALVMMDNVIQETIQYTRQRKIFQQPVLYHQSVRFRLAELQTEVELLRSLAHRATGRDSGPPSPNAVPAGTICSCWRRFEPPPSDMTCSRKEQKPSEMRRARSHAVLTCYRGQVGQRRTRHLTLGNKSHDVDLLPVVTTVTSVFGLCASITSPQLS